MAYAVPTNFAAGAVLTEAQLDVLGNDIVFLANPPKCRVYNSAPISHVASGTVQAVTFDSERYDTDTMHSTSVNTSRITFTTAGTFAVFGNLAFAANATGFRAIELRLNGTTYIASIVIPAVGGGIPTRLGVYTEYAFTAGQYVELIANQTSGGALNLEQSGNAYPEFGARWVSL